MLRLTASLAGALALMATGSASAASRGETIATQGTAGGVPACASCHGVSYQGMPALKAPAIAGLSQAYILARLAHYASPAGKNPSMKMVATALTPADRAAVAAYLASLPKAPGVAAAGK
ncbi:MAG TPA: c-type cytochrome [Caulobacteraceae bacterium]|jgi:cytochrome c553|nr:c-type cytochrome [Caulobacteraceae bacterium]